MSDEKVFVVTGAAGNVGATLTLLLIERGHRVVGVDRSAEALRARLGTSGAALLLPVADLSDAAENEAMVARVLAELGRLDGAAATVGMFAMAPLVESASDLWEQMLRVNVLTTLNLFRAALPPMRKAGGGSLVAIAAGAALRAPSGMAAYAAAKSAVLRLVESTADETRRERIRVNAVMPGTIDTPQNRAAMPDADPAHWVTTREVAEVIAFLLSDAASGVTGAALAVAGRT
jgi:NAD(P)-dependent dehydrogenase (short-subunit alcohol dehydrogenase family)